jgi:hypothetical protein
MRRLPSIDDNDATPRRIVTLTSRGGLGLREVFDPSLGPRAEVVDADLGSEAHRIVTGLLASWNTTSPPTSVNSALRSFRASVGTV